MQRLFSTFPNSWPGAGLLLLRVCLSIALIDCGVAGLLGTPAELTAVVQDLALAAGGIFLLAGLWTPVTGVLAALAEVWTALMPYPPRQLGALNHIFLSALAASVAMLGPGAWSIDARLFGRRRIDIGSVRVRRPSL